MSEGSLESVSQASIWSVHTDRIPLGTPTTSALVFTDLYALSLNRQTRFADWVGYRVTAASQAGRNSLNRNWLHLAKEFTIEAQDYEHSGYSIGHLCPLASVRADADAWEVNWTGAVAPQRQSLNAGPWLEMEEHTRKSAREHETVRVICGPLYEHDMPPMPECDEPHVVPSHYWARMTVPDTDTAIAWIMPQAAGRKDPHTDYVVEYSELVKRTGLIFPDAL